MQKRKRKYVSTESTTSRAKHTIIFLCISIYHQAALKNIKKKNYSVLRKKQRWTESKAVKIERMEKWHKSLWIVSNLLFLINCNLLKLILLRKLRLSCGCHQIVVQRYPTYLQHLAFKRNKKTNWLLSTKLKI